jgi:uncharacterized membrane protein YkoI
MRNLVLSVAVVAVVLLAVPALCINANEAQKIATDLTGGIVKETEQRSENGYPFYFVRVEVKGKSMIVKIGANSGKVYELTEWKPQK